jgi:hypothetical protein
MEIVSKFTFSHGRKTRRATRERKEERKLARLPKLKKPISAIWLEDVLPSWGDVSKQDQLPIEGLCFAGIPKEIRGRAWSAMLGNRLQIIEQLFDICIKPSKSRIDGNHQKNAARKTQQENNYKPSPGSIRIVLHLDQHSFFDGNNNNNNNSSSSSQSSRKTCSNGRAILKKPGATRVFNSDNNDGSSPENGQ